MYLILLIGLLFNSAHAEQVKLTDDAVAINREILFDFHLTAKVISTPSQILLDDLGIEYTSTNQGKMTQPLFLQTSILLQSADRVCRAFGGYAHTHLAGVDLGSSEDYIVTVIPRDDSLKPVQFDFIKFASLTRMHKISCRLR